MSILDYSKAGRESQRHDGLSSNGGCGYMLTHVVSPCIVSPYRALSHRSADDKCRADRSLERMGRSEGAARCCLLVQGTGDGA